jgi:hypothetical protein
MRVRRAGATHVRVVRLAGLLGLLYGLAVVAACAFLLAVGLDLHRRLRVGDAFGVPIVVTLIPIALCFGAVIAALGWTAVTASPGTAAAADVLSGAYAAIAYVGLARIGTDSPPVIVTGVVVIALVGAGIGYAVGERRASASYEQ